MAEVSIQCKIADYGMREQRNPAIVIIREGSYMKVNKTASRA
jgi:hypothetical protein